ncbi:DsbA family oxidoreductase [Oceaniglobus roseus]|uniref:DsbA family oxidoreductase n=1 Tax=Oceaniglobus roseus TaxID=1737570 RepID=UPI000C7E979B|nr:DsbA family oxidoreductase [Kandeliimicrobium roseum]
MQTVKLDILSDPICPWCFIGKTYLDRALNAHPDHPFALEWHPFQLNPDMPPEGMDRRAYLEAKFGGKENAVRVYAKIEETASEAGIAINWEGIRRTPNTLNAHRLIHWAGLEQRQTFAVDRLFKAYFQDGRDIGDPATLIEISEGIGMDPAMTERLLATDADVEDIRARDAHARSRGVTGVPTFILANTHALPGAQPTTLWAEVLEDLAAQAAAE